MAAQYCTIDKFMLKFFDQPNMLWMTKVARDCITNTALVKFRHMHEPAIQMCGQSQTYNGLCILLFTALLILSRAQWKGYSSERVSSPLQAHLIQQIPPFALKLQWFTAPDIQLYSISNRSQTSTVTCVYTDNKMKCAHRDVKVRPIYKQFFNVGGHMGILRSGYWELC